MADSSLSGRLRALRQGLAKGRSSASSKVSRRDSGTDARPAPPPPPSPPSQRLTRIAKDRPILTTPGTALGDPTTEVRDNLEASLDGKQYGADSSDRGLEGGSPTAKEALESALADAMAPALPWQRASSEELPQLTVPREGSSIPVDATSDKLERFENTAPTDDEVDALVSRIAQLNGTVTPSDLTSADHLDSLSRYSLPSLTNDPKPEPSSNLVSPSRAATPQASHPPLKVSDLSVSRSTPSPEPREPSRFSPTLDLHLPSAPIETPGAQDEDMLAQLASLEPVRADPGSSEALKNNIMARVAARRRERRSRPKAEGQPKSHSARIKSTVAKAKTEHGDEEGSGGSKDSDESD